MVLSHELSVNGEKKLLETGILIIKMDIAHFTGKPGNFNSLKLYYDTVTLKLTEDESRCQKKCNG